MVTCEAMRWLPLLDWWWWHVAGKLVPAPGSWVVVAAMIVARWWWWLWCLSSMVRMVVVAVQGLLAPCPDRSFHACEGRRLFGRSSVVECSWWIGSARVSGRSEVEAVCLCERV